MSYALVGGPAHGTVTVDSSGLYEYVPVGHYAGQDSFQFTASDGNGESDTGTITVDVTENPPIAQDVNLVAQVEDSSGIDDGYSEPLLPQVVTGGATFAAGTDLNSSGAISNPDGSTLTFAVVSGPSHGTAMIDPTGVITYVVNQTFGGQDSFTYTVSDGISTSQATVNIVMPQDPAPPQAPVTIYANVQIPYENPFGGPVPPGMRVIPIANPTSPRDYYYNDRANLYNAGQIDYPFQGGPPWNGPVGGALFKWDVKTAPMTTPQVFLGNVADLGVALPSLYTGVVLVRYDTPMGGSGVCVREFMWGWNLSNFLISTP